MAENEETVSFGAQKVRAQDKPRLVGQVFSSVAVRYDLMNDLMSAGVHRAWKDAAIQWLAPTADTHLIDVAGGTGDIALRFLERAGEGGSAHVTVCDINPDMLCAGVPRLERHMTAERAALVAADAERLPFPDQSFDAYTIAFGIRNVTRIEQALREAHRVLRPMGRFLCLEFSRVEVPGLAELYDLWSDHAIPAIGERVAGDRAAYEYLVESIRRFPPQEAFAAMISEEGFSRVSVRNLSGGIAAMHSGWRL